MPRKRLGILAGILALGEAFPAIEGCVSAEMWRSGYGLGRSAEDAEAPVTGNIPVQPLKCKDGC
jgi:hypothetical protein